MKFEIRNLKMGYNSNFLKTPVLTPKLNNPEDAYQLCSSETIDYTHFSLTLSLERKFAIWVAWNIDGSHLKRLPRKGIKFKEDPRIPSEFQAGNDLYKNNLLDRGHIARRIDLIWGNLEEAKKANNDSFFFTNIAPQMESFNQSGKGGVWGELENSLFEQVEMDNLKVSVIAGCIFNHNDKIYRNYKIPVEFYKTIIYKVDGKLKSKSFILSQNLDRLSVIDLDEFKTFEVTPTEIEAKCNFIFDVAIHNSSSFKTKNLYKKRLPLMNVQQIDW